MELLVSDIVGISCVVLISALCRQNSMWFPYLLGFIPLRIFGGGYHAKSHFSCIFIFSLSFLLLLWLKDFWRETPFIELKIAIIVLVIALLFSPAEAEKKPLSNKLRRKNRKICICLATSNCLLACVSYLAFCERSVYVLEYFVGSFSAGISIILALLQKRIKNGGMM